MQRQHEPSRNEPSAEINTQPSTTMDMKELQDDFKELPSLFTKKYSYTICPQTGRIVINVPEGIAIIEDGRMKKYYGEDSPFRGKAGVKLSSILPYSNLIAVVPDKQAIVTYQVPNLAGQSGYGLTTATLYVHPFTVYIYDLIEKSIIYEKNFNCQIDYLKISNAFIAVSNSERVVIFDYKKRLRGGHLRIRNPLQQLIAGYKKGVFDDTVRYMEVEGDGSLSQGELHMSLQEPARLSFIKKERHSLYVYDSDLDIFLDIPMNKDETHVCMSPDGRFAALVSQGGISIRIIDIDTREVFTEFKRGRSQKEIACMGFCGNWFSIASRSNNNATFHFFQLRKKNDAQQIIYSQYKRYFNTFQQPIDFFISDNKVKVFSLVGCTFEILNLQRAKAKHAEDASRAIEIKDVAFWSLDP